jgi:hypothetical protein
MSHFAVLVVTDSYPTEEILTETLQPWHEYECTGIRDQYVLDTDITDGAFAEYSEDTERRLKGQLALDCMKEAQVVKRRKYVTNALADAESKIPANFPLGIDINNLICKVAESYPKVRADYEALDPQPAYFAYLDGLTETAPLNPVVMARELGMFGYGGLYETGFKPTETDLEAFIQAAPALSAWAFVKDGEWFQKGQIGWFGLSADDDECWPLKFQELLDSVDDTQYLTVVDCHI